MNSSCVLISRHDHVLSLYTLYRAISYSPHFHQQNAQIKIKHHKTHFVLGINLKCVLDVTTACRCRYGKCRCWYRMCRRWYRMCRCWYRMCRCCTEYELWFEDLLYCSLMCAICWLEYGKYERNFPAHRHQQIIPFLRPLCFPLYSFSC